MRYCSLRKQLFISTSCLIAALGLCWFVLARPRPCPLAVHFVGFTNYSGQRCAAFIVSNRSDIALEFTAMGEHKGQGQWPVYAVGTVMPHRSGLRVGPRQIHDLYTPVLASGTPMRMSVLCREPWTQWEQRRWVWSVWLQDHNLGTVGRADSTGKPCHVLLSQEVHE